MSSLIDPFVGKKESFLKPTRQLASIQECHDFKGVKIGYLNIRSLVKKVDEIQLLLLHSRLDILILSETFLTSSIENSEIGIQGYYIIRADRTMESGKRTGGGLVVYIRKDRVVELMEETVICCPDIEALWMKFMLPDTRPIYICGLYRPPSGNQSVFCDWLDESLIKIEQCKFGDVLVTGDTNIDLKTLNRNNQYHKVLKNNNLSQLITKHTRVTEFSKTLIDHFSVNCPELYHQHGVLDTGITDHSMLIVVRKKLPISRASEFVFFRDFAKADFKLIQDKIRTANWEDFYNSNDTDTCTEIFHHIMNKIITENVPLKRHRVRENWPKWLTGEYLDLVKDRERANRNFKLNNSENNKIIKKTIEKQCKNLKRSLQRQYIEESLKEYKSEPKKLWKTIHEFWGKSKGPTEILKIGDTTDKNEISERLNLFFGSIGRKLSETIISDGTDPLVNFPYNLNNTLNLMAVDSQDVRKAIDRLSATKAGKDDGISAKIVKNCVESLCPILQHLFNTSISEGTFPTQWKSATIIPLFKEGSRSCESNYRPISLLCTLGKVLERLIHLQVSEYFESHGLLCREQSGFRRGCSTGTCLLEFLDKIYLNIEKRVTSGVLFLDLKKAFDTVDHVILLKKLERYGANPMCVKWFKSYLTGRKCHVRVNGVTSNECTVSCGVPQGSILGPLLFTIYVNDISHHMRGLSMNLYADDTAIMVSDKDPTILQNRLEDALNQASIWLKRNKLSLNIKKTQIMIFGSKQQVSRCNFELKFKNEYVKQTKTFKYLGVILDETLSFSSHAEHIRSKTMGRVGVLGRLRDRLSRDMSLMLYRTLILPIFDYCDIVCDSLGMVNASKLQKVQNKAFRIITRSAPLTRTSYIHNELQMPYLDCRRQYHTLIHVNNILTENVHPQYDILCNYLQVSHEHHTRSVDRQYLVIKQTRSKMAEGSFHFRGSSLWNNYVRNHEEFGSKPPKVFKEQLKLFMHIA